MRANGNARARERDRKREEKFPAAREQFVGLLGVRRFNRERERVYTYRLFLEDYVHCDREYSCTSSNEKERKKETPFATLKIADNRVDARIYWRPNAIYLAIARDAPE